MLWLMMEARSYREFPWGHKGVPMVVKWVPILYRNTRNFLDCGFCGWVNSTKSNMKTIK